MIIVICINNQVSWNVFCCASANRLNCVSELAAMAGGKLNKFSLISLSGEFLYKYFVRSAAVTVIIIEIFSDFTTPSVFALITIISELSALPRFLLPFLPPPQKLLRRNRLKHEKKYAKFICTNSD